MPKTLVRDTPKHGVLIKTGKRKPLRLIELPPWHGWHYEDEAARIIRWCERYLVLPKGYGAGERFRIAKHQRRDLKTICDSIASFFSVAAGNGKTTFMTAVGLERICRGDEYVVVDILATKEDQAQRMIESAIRFVECSPELHELCDYRAGESTLEYRPTGSVMRAHPARLSAVQGLEFQLALIDEIGFVPAELVTALLARLGKAPDARVIGFGTPGFEPDNLLEAMRSLSHADDLPPGVRFIEYMAEPGCDVSDREQRRKANPALEAGYMREEALDVQMGVMLAAGREHEYRAYHLGQPVDSSGPWLPYGAWEECVLSEAPRDGTPIVLGVWGNYLRRVAVVGATLDGQVFFGWEGEKPTDDELGTVLRKAAEQWEVLELCHKPHIRLGLMAQLADEGIPITSWVHTKEDASSTTALYQAIAEERISHDHSAVLADQVSRLEAKVDRQGNPKLVEAEDVPAALAMRAAWWRARQLAENHDEQVVIYW
jgi:hypothetical protein